MTLIRIILADDHTLIREGFKSLLGGGEFEVVGEVDNGADLQIMVDELLPDVVLLDLSMPRMSGLEALEKLHNRWPDVSFIILTMHEEREYVVRALSAGADGYLLKNVEKPELERAIRSVLAGQKYLSPAISSMLAQTIANPDPELPEVTPREKEVLGLVAAGKSTKQIADELGISIRTVETHRINLLKKLRANNTAELIRKSIHLKII